MKNKIFKVFYLLIASIVMISCKEEVPETNSSEQVKELTGTWKIVSLIRNGEDLSKRMDLSKFKVVFKNDGTYSLVDRMAFVVSDPGTFTLNDPQYPSSLTLTPTGKTAQKLEFLYPIIGGKRQLSLTLSPGCTGNVYQYNFVREN